MISCALRVVTNIYIMICIIWMNLIFTNVSIGKEGLPPLVRWVQRCVCGAIPSGFGLQ